MNRYICKSVFIVLLLVLSQCKSIERMTRPKDAFIDYRETIMEGLDTKKYPRFLLVENAGMKISGDRNVNAQFTLFIEKDRRIFANAKFLGFEIFRAEITPDSVKFINRIEREYFFGNMNEYPELIPLGYDFNTLQNFIYSGFYQNEQINKKDFIRDFYIAADKIEFTRIVDEGQKIELMYDKSFVKLDKMLLSDFKKQFLAEINIQRNVFDVEEIEAILYIKKNRTDVLIDIGDIENREYKKTGFNISRNYRELESIF